MAIRTLNAMRPGEPRSIALALRIACFLPAICVLLSCHGKSGQPVAPKPVEAFVIQRLASPGLHNLFRVTDRLYSGSSPEGDTGFASLARMGVKTIVSVDGAAPDVVAAKRHGMDYIHLPFGYDGVPRARILALAKLVEIRSGPFYVHCHHGLHRGPVAVTVMQLCVDPRWDATAAEHWLQQAGTSPQYPGLFRLPRTLNRPTADELTSAPVEFPATDLANDLASLMVNVDARWDRLKQVRAAGWVSPADHPDIDPPHEAVQLLEQYREALRLPSVSKRDPNLVSMFNDAETNMRELVAALRERPVDLERASEAFVRAAAQCATCHNRFRDVPKSPH